MTYIKDYRENVIHRAKLLNAATLDDKMKQDLYTVCSRDILYWINHFCFTKDPRRKPDILPFITYDFQDKHILEMQKAIENGEDIIIEKSRDMGASWMVIYGFLWFWLFKKGSDFRVGSRKEDFVDKIGDLDTLLEKVRFCLMRLPIWMLPQGFSFDKHATYMKIQNPANGNTIIGESANEHFGSGGRRKAILLDEFAKWDNSVAYAAWTSTADVSPCRICLSTPVGSGNKFAELAKGTKNKIKKISLHWTLHPLKAEGAYYMDGSTKIPVPPEKANELWNMGVKVRSPWYDAECERRSESDIAQELDIDYLASGSPFFSPLSLKKQKAWVYYKRPTPHGPVPYGKYITGNLVEQDHRIVFIESPNGWLRVFELPKSNWLYSIGGDVSEGLAKGDESTCVVRDKYSRNVVAVYNGLIGTDVHAERLQKINKYYASSVIACERNNHGHSVNQDLKGMDCALYHPRNAKGEIEIDKAGWDTNARTRPLMLDQMEEEIRKNTCELRDENLINQCFTFVKHKTTGKPQADGNFHDDLVIAHAISGTVIQDHQFKNVSGKSENASKQRNLAKDILRSRAKY